jgi:hypothetical protein
VKAVKVLWGIGMIIIFELQKYDRKEERLFISWFLDLGYITHKKVIGGTIFI